MRTFQANAVGRMIKSTNVRQISEGITFTPTCARP